MKRSENLNDDFRGDQQTANFVKWKPNEEY